MKQNTLVVVRDALRMMQVSTQHVIGTDGHRRLCRHEGNAYTILFGPPSEFCTPNLADGKQPLLLRVHNEKNNVDASLDSEGILPKYRDMLARLARDPVGQTSFPSRYASLLPARARCTDRLHRNPSWRKTAGSP